VKLYTVDLERLGRLDHNRRSGSRRQKAYRADNRRYWNHDREIGALLYHRLSVHQDRINYSLQRC
jgi:hypothetical protein